MPTATLTSKGQITIPLALRTALGLNAGSRLDVVQENDGFRLTPLRMASSSLKGRFAGRATKVPSIADMDRAIGAEVAARQASTARS